MRKILSLSALSLAAMIVASCSTSDDFSDASKNGLDASEPVLISLNAASATSRGFIESDDNQNFETDNIGVYMLTKNSDVFWNISSSTNIQYYGSWWKNIYAKAEKTTRPDGTVCTQLKTSYEGKQDEEHAYYPAYPSVDNYAYNFYAYSPRVDASLNITSSSDSYIARIPIDGQTDIIWGKASSSNTNAYSAKYFRSAGTSAETPCLQMSHRLIGLQFCAKAGEYSDNGSVNVNGAQRMGIYSVNIENVPTYVSLTIANRTNSSADGQVVSGTSYSSLAIPDSLSAFKDMNNHLVESTQLQNVGQRVIVPRGKYTVSVILYDKQTGIQYPTQFTVDLSDTSKYAQGSIYNVVMTVYGPKIVSDLKATLNKWNTSDGGSVEFN